MERSKIIDMRDARAKRDAANEARLERLVIERWTGPTNESQDDADAERPKRSQ